MKIIFLLGAVLLMCISCSPHMEQAIQLALLPYAIQTLIY